MNIRNTALATLAAWALIAIATPCAPAQSNETAFPAPPDGFDRKREGIERGKLEPIVYESATVGIARQARVYTPPGYSGERKYPVLYLLHGIGGDENEWPRGGAPDVILDNLHAEQKLVPMIVVMPNGRASKELTEIGRASCKERV